jgi:hypothetical protein
MNVISLPDIARVLKQYSERYRWLDVFAYQVSELRGQSGLKFFKQGENRFSAQVGTDQLDLQMYPDKGVVRFSLGTGQPESSDVVAGAAIGAMVGLGVRPKGPEGLILGLLLGGLVGAALGNNRVDENRIMTLRYDPATASWRVYHGPYIQWAKEALRPT